jgi:hypothetical protein
MGLSEFKSSVEFALRLLSQEKRVVKDPIWLHERALAGMANARLDNLPAGLGFQLGVAAGRFHRIAREVAEADGNAEREQFAEAAAALRTIAEILKSLPTE